MFIILNTMSSRLIEKKVPNKAAAATYHDKLEPICNNFDQSGDRQMTTKSCRASCKGMATQLHTQKWTVGGNLPSVDNPGCTLAQTKWLLVQHLEASVAKRRYGRTHSMGIL